MKVALKDSQLYEFLIQSDKIVILLAIHVVIFQNTFECMKRYEITNYISIRYYRCYMMFVFVLVRMENVYMYR